MHGQVFPEYTGCRDGIAPMRPGAKLDRVDPTWMRVFYDNTRARTLLGMRFRDWDNTLAATVDSLTQIGGVVPAK